MHVLGLEGRTRVSREAGDWPRGNGGGMVQGREGPRENASSRAVAGAWGPGGLGGRGGCGGERGTGRPGPELSCGAGDLTEGE